MSLNGDLKYPDRTMMISHPRTVLDYDIPYYNGGHNVITSKMDLSLPQVTGDVSMTPEKVREIREKLGLSQTALGDALRLGANGKRTVARWEAGAPISGPVQIALEALCDGWRPGDGRFAELREEYLAVLDNVSKSVADAYCRVKIVGQLKDSET